MKTEEGNSEVSKCKRYFMLTTKRGNPIINGAKLPIFWRKSVAVDEGNKFKASISRVVVLDEEEYFQLLDDYKKIKDQLEFERTIDTGL